MFPGAGHQLNRRFYNLMSRRLPARFQAWDYEGTWQGH